MCSTSIYTKTQRKEPFLRSARSDKQTKTMPRNRQNVVNKIQKKKYWQGKTGVTSYDAFYSHNVQSPDKIYDSK